MSAPVHAAWCDPVEHALSESDGYPGRGCLGRPIERGPAAGWLTDPAGSGIPEIAMDWRPADQNWGTLTLREAADLVALLTAVLAEALADERLDVPATPPGATEDEL